MSRRPSSYASLVYPPMTVYNMPIPMSRELHSLIQQRARTEGQIETLKRDLKGYEGELALSNSEKMATRKELRLEEARLAAIKERITNLKSHGKGGRRTRRHHRKSSKRTHRRRR